MDEFARRLAARVTGEVLTREPLERYTSYRLGGPADVFVSPRSLEDVVEVQRLAREADIPVTVIGGGSNLLIADEGVRGVVVRIGRELNKIEFDDDTVVAECGAPFPRLAKLAVQRSLGGIEFGGGIPGYVGGALAMNAGAHDECIADFVREVTAVNPDGDVVTLTNEDMEFSYRMSRLQREPRLIAVKTKLCLFPGPSRDIREKMRTYMEKRRRTQPLGTKNAGSVFKNPPGDYAGRLIEAAGCKGMTEGDAIVSPMHANFIVNRGEATAADVRRLIEKVQANVYERFGVELTPEVHMLGFA